jgi:hypothetical protein
MINFEATCLLNPYCSRNKKKALNNSGTRGARADLRPVLECWIHAEQTAGTGGTIS